MVLVTENTVSIISYVSIHPCSRYAELPDDGVYSYQFKYVLITGHRVFKDHSAKRVEAMKMFPVKRKANVSIQCFC